MIKKIIGFYLKLSSFEVFLFLMLPFVLAGIVRNNLKLSLIFNGIGGSVYLVWIFILSTIIKRGINPRLKSKYYNVFYIILIVSWILIIINLSKLFPLDVLQYFNVICFFFIMYFISSEFLKYEVNHIVEKKRIFFYSFLFFVFFIGVWDIHPRLKSSNMIKDK